MAETNGSLRPIDHQNPILQSFFQTLDPISLLLSQNSEADEPVPLKLTTESFYLMERGPRYRAYAELRESKLRMKKLRQQREEEEAFEDPEPRLTPAKKQVKFQGEFHSKRSSALAQSVPDFSAALRKENRKPSNALPPLLELTPPAKNRGKANWALSNSRGSKSANAGEKRVMMGRKSYASIEELRGLSSAANHAIVENRGGGGGGRRGASKTLLGYRKW